MIEFYFDFSLWYSFTVFGFSESKVAAPSEIEFIRERYCLCGLADGMWPCNMTQRICG